MFTISGDDLSVMVLDPVADRDRLGTRFTAAGQMFRITDGNGMDLMSGPTFPDTFNTYDAQGIPDSFNHLPLYDSTSRGGDVGRLALVLGIGVVDGEANRIIRPSVWDIRREASSATFTAREQFGPYDVTLVRNVTIAGRVITSRTEVHNDSNRFLPLSWYPHPFFPFHVTRDVCWFHTAPQMPENSGYTFSDGVLERAMEPDAKGFFQPLTYNKPQSLSVHILHDRVGKVVMKTDYPVWHFPIWGNNRTFSVEPYLERTVFPGEQFAWNLTYRMG